MQQIRDFKDTYIVFRHSFYPGKEIEAFCAGMCLAWINDCILECNKLDSGGVAVNRPAILYRAGHMAQQVLRYASFSKREKSINILNQQSERLNRINNKDFLIKYQLVNGEDAQQLLNHAFLSNHTKQMFGLSLCLIGHEPDDGHEVAFFRTSKRFFFLDPNLGVYALTPGDSFSTIMSFLNEKYPQNNYRIRTSMVNILAKPASDII